jgi:large subunit ribosomal protein L13
MRTYSTKAKDIEREWRVIDAADKTLGSVATQIASLLMGKHKPIYAPYIDTGDYVVVVNAAKVKVTGKKAEQKMYYRHSGYPGGLKSSSFKELFGKDPGRVIEFAVKGMLPHNRLGRVMFKKLRVYPGDEHPHQAQTAVRQPKRTKRRRATKSKGSEILSKEG